ncbi:LPS translocon maturation chaperone LptM [Nitrincola sp.]
MKILWSMVFASLLLLSGCGQKGPLYLPDQPDTTTEQGE